MAVLEGEIRELLEEAKLRYPLPYGPDGDLRTVRDADLVNDVLHVLFDRLVADVQRLGDFLIRKAKCNLAKHIAFTWSQRDFNVR